MDKEADDRRVASWKLRNERRRQGMSNKLLVAGDRERNREAGIASWLAVTQLPKEDTSGGLQAQILHILPFLLARD